MDKYDHLITIIKDKNIELLRKIAADEFPEEPELQSKFVNKYLKEAYYTLELVRGDPKKACLKYYDKSLKNAYKL